jgi:hypothetical protein
MANNALIQGAARASKKFVDIGGAVGKAFASMSSPERANSRVDENKAIQARVNNSMSKMKTDMDFTSFSPEETATMRNFLLEQRSVYAEAAKMAAKFDDTTDPEYMNYVDQMQGVNNSFTNLASQLKSYKQGKLDYAQNQLEGLYSNGNEPSVNNNAATIFGFIDEDQDKRTDKRLDSPFQILQGGNLGFNIDGNEISYNDMPMPGLKDNKLANSILTKNEAIYNQGTRGGELNPEMLKAYEINLKDQLQNRDALRSIVFDYESELGMFTEDQEDELNLALKSGTISYDDLRKKVVDKLVQARKDVFNDGKKEYDIKQAKLKKEINNLSNPNQVAANLAAEFKLSSGLTDVELFHPVYHPTKKESYEIRATSEGGYEWRQKGGNIFFPLEAENVFNLDISKINISGAVSGDDEIGYNQQLYDDIKALLGIRGIPTAEQDLEIIAKMNEI